MKNRTKSDRLALVYTSEMEALEEILKTYARHYQNALNMASEYEGLDIYYLAEDSTIQADLYKKKIDEIQDRLNEIIAIKRFIRS